MFTDFIPIRECPTCGEIFVDYVKEESPDTIPLDFPLYTVARRPRVWGICRNGHSYLGCFSILTEHLIARRELRAQITKMRT